MPPSAESQNETDEPTQAEAGAQALCKERIPTEKQEGAGWTTRPGHLSDVGRHSPTLSRKCRGGENPGC